MRKYIIALFCLFCLLPGLMFGQLVRSQGSVPIDSTDLHNLRVQYSHTVDSVKKAYDSLANKLTLPIHVDSARIDSILDVGLVTNSLPALKISQQSQTLDFFLRRSIRWVNPNGNLLAGGITYFPDAPPIPWYNYIRFGESNNLYLLPMSGDAIGICADIGGNSLRDWWIRSIYSRGDITLNPHYGWGDGKVILNGTSIPDSIRTKSVDTDSLKFRSLRCKSNNLKIDSISLSGTYPNDTLVFWIGGFEYRANLFRPAVYDIDSAFLANLVDSLVRARFTSPPKIATATGIYFNTDSVSIKISSETGGKVKSWFILAPPRGICTISVDGTVRYVGKFGNLFMSRAIEIRSDDGRYQPFTSKYFSVTSILAVNHTCGHNTYFDIPFVDSVIVKITDPVPFDTYYNIFYEVGRSTVNSPYTEFYAYSRDSVLSDAKLINDTLLALSNVGKGVYYSLYFWTLGDSASGRAYLERDFYVTQDGNNIRFATGTEDYPGYYYYFGLNDSMKCTTSDFHGSPTSGVRPDNHYLDCFYRIHEEDRVPFDNDFILYWEKTPDVVDISRYCHIGYTVIYYLATAQ